MKAFPMLALLLIAIVSPAIAIDPGKVEGTFLVNRDTIPLRYAYAHQHDNAEGLLDPPKRLRILLTDREVPPSALAGIVFLPVEEMARQGKVRGLLMELDPNDLGNVTVTLLLAPNDPGRSLMTQTLSVTGGSVFGDWQMNDRRVAGSIEHGDGAEPAGLDLPAMSFSLRFSAPLFHEPPVTADLKGKDARNSPQFRVLAAKADALARGDFDGVRKLSTEGVNRRYDVLYAQRSDEVKSMAKQASAEMKKMLGKVQRVVVRGDRAVAIFSKNEWSTFVLENGEWKSGD
jgi:hypothetical protein